MDGRDPRWGIRIDTPLTHPSLEDARAWMEGERKACVRRREHRVKRVGVAPTFSRAEGTLLGTAVPNFDELSNSVHLAHSNPRGCAVDSEDGVDVGHERDRDDEGSDPRPRRREGRAPRRAADTGAPYLHRVQPLPETTTTQPRDSSTSRATRAWTRPGRRCPSPSRMCKLIEDPTWLGRTAPPGRRVPTVEPRCCDRRCRGRRKGSGTR